MASKKQIKYPPEQVCFEINMVLKLNSDENAYIFASFNRFCHHLKLPIPSTYFDPLLLIQIDPLEMLSANQHKIGHGVEEALDAAENAITSESKKKKFGPLLV